MERFIVHLACGRGCTKVEYDRAVKDSNILVRLMGDGWAPVVWKNLGWHYRVERGVAKIYPSWGERFIVYFNTIIQSVITHKDPKRALAQAIRDAQDHIVNLAKDISDVRNNT